MKSLIKRLLSYLLVTLMVVGSSMSVLADTTGYGYGDSGGLDGCIEGEIFVNFTFDGINFDDFAEENAEMIAIGNAKLNSRNLSFGMLNRVPRLLQGDSRWGHVVMGTGGAGTCSGSRTIASIGCALTSFTMVHQYFGGTGTPATVNTTMGTWACPFAWDIAANRHGITLVGGMQRPGNNGILALVIGAITMGRPVVIGMTHPTTTHFVVAHGFNGSTIFIQDPASGNRTTLTQYLSAGYTVTSALVYSGPIITPPTLCDDWGNCFIWRGGEQFEAQVLYEEMLNNIESEKATH